MATQTVQPPTPTALPADQAARPPAVGLPTRRRSRPRLRPFRASVCVLAALAATFGISYASARWMPFVRPGAGAANGFGSNQSLDRVTDTVQRVEVGVWGDHLRPWHLRLTTPLASRLVWFEKGRVYSRSDVKVSPLASSAAVSCWSFATECWRAVGSAVTGPLPSPPELSESNAAGRTWATAIEERGWPFRAFTCRLSAPMGDASAPIYAVEGGHFVEAQPAGPVPASMAFGQPAGDIQSLRAIPTTPIWPGLLADTVILGAAFYLLTLIPTGLLGLRRKPGHCPRCRYDLRALGGEAAGCPECGWKREEPPPTA